VIGIRLANCYKLIDLKRLIK